MKKLRTAFIGLAILAYSCQEKEDPIIEEPTFENQESEWIRVITINGSGNVSMMNPITGEVKTPTVQPFAQGSANYLSSSGRYITSIERTNGVVKFFDTGIENHEDHGHEYEMRWLSGSAIAPLPTHFSATNGNIVIFNDGDGSITWARESNMETPSFNPTIIKDLNNGVHHGAATWLLGDKLAVTYKNPEIPGALPQTIKILSSTGQVLTESAEVKVTGIHGDASNGQYAIFGGTEGVLVARSNNQIFRIDNISPMEATSGNWMGTVKGHDKSNIFYGWARNKGIFAIDPAAKTIRNIYAGDDVSAYFFSADGSKLIVQTKSNSVKVLDSKTGNQIAEGPISVASTGDESARKIYDDASFYRLMNELPPVLTSSEKFLYVLSPSRTEIEVLDLENLNSVKKMTLTAPVSSFMRIGFQTN
jgi:WD40 repeat protein